MSDKKYQVRYWNKIKNKDAGICLDKMLTLKQADKLIEQFGKETKTIKLYKREKKIKM
jgi:hypothetical protein